MTRPGLYHVAAGSAVTRVCSRFAYICNCLQTDDSHMGPVSGPIAKHMPQTASDAWAPEVAVAHLGSPRAGVPRHRAVGRELAVGRHAARLLLDRSDSD